MELLRINLKHTRYIDIKDVKAVPKMNVLESTIYHSVLTGMSLVFLIGLVTIGLYTLKLINTVPFYSIIYK